MDATFVWGLILCIALLIVGIVLIVKGGDWFVDAASWLAKISGIPTFIIGATIVSLATTLPEIIVSSLSAAQGNAGLAIGNAVGSVNCNIALIMGISVLFMPLFFKRKDYLFKMILLVVAIASLFGLVLISQYLLPSGRMEWWQGLIMFAIFGIFMAENVIGAKKMDVLEEDLSEGSKEDVIEEKIEPSDKTITLKKSGKVILKKDLVKNIILFIVGAGCIVGGAELLCINGENLAVTYLKVPEEIVGVTILAIGTSLPELVTTITAIAKKQSDLSIGNIVGANIIDITLILGLCAVITTINGHNGLEINSQLLIMDLPFCLLVSVIACVPALIRSKFSRWQGIALFTLYLGYTAILVLSAIGVINFDSILASIA